jgi:hypothetical protein
MTHKSFDEQVRALISEQVPALIDEYLRTQTEAITLVAAQAEDPRPWRAVADLTEDDNTATKVRENSLRRLAARGRYELVKSRARDPRAADYGRYKIVESKTGQPVAGAEGPGGFGLSLDEAEAVLSAVTTAGVIFAVRDDGPAETWHPDKVGQWYPSRPDEILPDRWVVGSLRLISGASHSPFAGHKVVFAYEDHASGRLPDDSPRGTEYRLYGKSVRFTKSAHDAMWGITI